jgi:DNA-binding transcriptional MerR regulator
MNELRDPSLRQPSRVRDGLVRPRRPVQPRDRPEPRLPDSLQRVLKRDEHVGHLLYRLNRVDDRSEACRLRVNGSFELRGELPAGLIAGTALSGRHHESVAYRGLCGHKARPDGTRAAMDSSARSALVELDDAIQRSERSLTATQVRLCRRVACVSTTAVTPYGRQKKCAHRQAPTIEPLGLSRFSGEFHADPATTLALHCHVDSLPAVRVWELAEELRVTSSDVLELIKQYDAYVTSHFAAVPRQALDAIRASPPQPRWSFGDYWDMRTEPSSISATVGPSSTPAPRKPLRFRRRPGPERITFEMPYEEDEDGYGNDPLEDLQYEPIWSTRDVAAYYDVKRSTVRQWVRRGHLKPCGKEGPSHIFEREDVFTATDAIAARRRKPGLPDPAKPRPTPRPGFRDPFDEYLARFGQRRRPAGRGPDPATGLAGVGTRGLHRLATVTPNALVNTDQAAALVGLTASTIRSWVRRGHLKPAPHAPGERGHRFRVADIYGAAGPH